MCVDWSFLFYFILCVSTNFFFGESFLRILREFDMGNSTSKKKTIYRLSFASLTAWGVPSQRIVFSQRQRPAVDMQPRLYSHAPNHTHHKSSPLWHQPLASQSRRHTEHTPWSPAQSDTDHTAIPGRPPTGFPPEMGNCYFKKKIQLPIKLPIIFILSYWLSMKIGISNWSDWVKKADFQ